MDASEDFRSEQQKIQAALVAVNRSANSITSEDLTFQRTVNPDVASQLDDSAARLLSLTNRLLKSSAAATGRKAPPELEDADDVDLNWQGVVDVIDALLEKADTSLDEYTGMLKRKDAPTTEVGPESKKPKPTTERLDWSIRRANIAKPQELFEHKPNNHERGPWKPLLSSKPHAIVPLAESLTTFVDENETVQYKHPYETEITQMKYPEAVYHKSQPIRYQPTEGTSAVWVDTFEGVQAMLEELRKADVIAVDLEHHDFRTYAGLLSLMQISTREKDWVVDTLKPWRCRLEILNEVFADPTKIKVFHGATSDIVWLQRDLGLYIVGLFDTYFACDCLEYPARSLAYLLKRFVDFDADKKYQMADWRIRPLPEEMFYYARSDTHFLLYIYDMVRNELAEKSEKLPAEGSLTEYVLQKSKETSLLRHEAALCDPETGLGSRGWLNSLMRTYTALSGEQFAVFKALFRWRDELARQLDESPGFIMPIRSVGDIARIMPSDRKAMWSLLNNAARVTKSSMEEIFLLVQQAKVRGAGGPSSAEFLRSDAVGVAAKTDLGKGSGGSSGAAGASREAREAARAKELAKLPDLSEVRSGVSQLWGSTPIGGKKKVAAEDEGESGAAGVHMDTPWFSFVQAAVAAGLLGPADEARATATSAGKRAEEDYIEFPQSAGTPVVPGRTASTAVPPELPAVTTAADAAADDTSSLSSSSSSSSSESESESESSSSDEEFTLKGGKTNKKNKKGAAEKGVVLTAENGTVKEGKPAKAGKKAKKPTASEEGEGSGGQTQTSDSDGGAPVGSEEFVPFNYDTAGSVMHPKKTDQKPTGGGRKKVFDPYRSKTGADGPKGARRMHFERNGKSATFKK